MLDRLNSNHCSMSPNHGDYEKYKDSPDGNNSFKGAKALTER